MNYYDLVLGLIPLTLLGLTGLLKAVGVSLTVAVPVAGTASVALVGHAMFVRSPTDVRSSDNRTDDRRFVQ